MTERKADILSEYERARYAMVENQIAARGINDARVLRAMEKVPRHLFVDEALRSQAYGDFALPIGEGQTISQPYIVALMLKALELKGNEKVLEIGTGSGYLTALLCELSLFVCSIERLDSLVERARARLKLLGYKNVKLKAGDGTLGWEEEKPFEGIVVSAASPNIPEQIIFQLKIGGRLVLPVGTEYAQTLMKITLLENSRRIDDLGGCRFVKLIGRYGWPGEIEE